MNNKFQKFLREFDENQIRDINDFINSSQGSGLKKKINNADKEKLLREFEKLDPAVVKKKMKGMSTADIIKLINKL